MAFVTATKLTYALKSGEDVLYWIAKLSFGWFMLLMVSIGITGYIFSRVYLALNNTDYDGADHKPYFRRAGYLINATGYGLLLISCITILLGINHQGDSDIKLMILNSVFGKIVVYVIAIGLLISAINEWWISFATMMNKMTHSRDLSSRQYRYLLILGRFGRFCRGIVFAVFAYILARSAYYNLDNLPKGADAAFMFISVTYGAYVMGFIAFGIICYGMFLIISARHRNIPII